MKGTMISVESLEGGGDIFPFLESVRIFFSIKDPRSGSFRHSLNARRVV